MLWLRREAIVLAVFGGFGLLILPALVYLVGQQLLGEYRPGAGMGAFYGDFYGLLGTFSIWAWVLALGPWLAVVLLRFLWLPLRHLARGSAAAPEEPRADGRVEPTI